MAYFRRPLPAIHKGQQQRTADHNPEPQSRPPPLRPPIPADRLLEQGIQLEPKAVVLLSVVPPCAAGDWTCPLNVLVTLYAKYRQAPPISLVADLNFTRFLLVFLSLTPHSQRMGRVHGAWRAPPTTLHPRGQTCQPSGTCGGTKTGYHDTSHTQKKPCTPTLHDTILYNT